MGEGVERLVQELRQQKVGPTIRELSKKFDRIRTREIEKHFGNNGMLGQQQRELVEACTSAIVNKILHDPILLMKTEETKEGGPKYSEVLKKLFGLEGK